MSTTEFAALCRHCGLCVTEAAMVLDARAADIKSWSSGRRPTPKRALDTLRALARRIDTAATEALRVIASQPTDVPRPGIAAAAERRSLSIHAPERLNPLSRAETREARRGFLPVS